MGREMDHRNIVKFYEMFEFEGEVYIIMELCQNNSLKGNLFVTQRIHKK